MRYQLLKLGVRGKLGVFTQYLFNCKIKSKGTNIDKVRAFHPFFSQCISVIEKRFRETIDQPVSIWSHHPK